MFSKFTRCIRKILLGAGFFLCASIVQANACHPQRAPTKAYGANPITTYMIAVLAPEKLIGWNFAPPPQAAGYFPDPVMKLPIVGGWFGQGKTPNLEMLVSLRPDVSLTSAITVSTDVSIPMLEKLGIPVCNLEIEQVEDYPLAFRRAGAALGVPERGEALAVMAESLLTARTKAKAHFQMTKPRVYYAEGADGLATECRGSVHAEWIELAGGENVHICPSHGENRFGMVRIDFEQLAAYDPDWIVTQDPSLAERISSYSRWQALRAVREGRVLLAPQVPFRWLDRPPSYMRLLAMHWLAERIQPRPYTLDVAKATQEFFKLFFQRELDATAVQAVLNPGVR